jgi:hypothetical protein
MRKKSLVGGNVSSASDLSERCLFIVVSHSIFSTAMNAARFDLYQTVARHTVVRDRVVAAVKAAPASARAGAMRFPKHPANKISHASNPARYMHRRA